MALSLLHTFAFSCLRCGFWPLIWVLVITKALKEEAWTLLPRNSAPPVAVAVCLVRLAWSTVLCISATFWMLNSSRDIAITFEVCWCAINGTWRHELFKLSQRRPVRSVRRCELAATAVGHIFQHSVLDSERSILRGVTTVALSCYPSSMQIIVFWRLQA